MRSDGARARAALAALTALTALTALGCGVRGGDVLVSEPPVFYISPAGSDENPGTELAPWLTFAYAIPRLHAAETLVLLDGVYQAATTGYLEILCGTNAENGSPDRPITVRARHERQAFLEGDGSAVPVRLAGCAHWVIDGLYAAGADNKGEPGGEAGSIFVITGSSHDLVLRRTAAARPNRYFSASVFLIAGGVSDILVEESEAYDFHFFGFHAYQGTRVTFRRDYANGRARADLADGFATGYPAEGDGGFLLTMSADALIENSIAEGVAEGFTVAGERSSTGSAHPPTRSQLLGDIATGISQIGFVVDSRCDDTVPCVAADHMVTNTRFAGSVSLGGRRGFYSEGGLATVLENVSVLGATESGVWFSKESDNLGMASTSFARSSLVVAPSAQYGFRVDQQDEWLVTGCDSVGPATPFSPRDGHVVGALETDPGLGDCLVYRPPGSPRGALGAVGASVVYRTEAGALTGKRLWDATTGAFPCGAPVPGLNDATRADASCIGVHERLHVGTGGCPLP